MSPENDRYLSKSQVKDRYANASDMWLYRRERKDKDFPKALVMGGRKFYRLSDLLEWERKVEARKEEPNNPYTCAQIAKPKRAARR